MIEIPKNISQPAQSAIKRAQRSISTGSIPVDVVEELIRMVVTQHEDACFYDKQWRERERLLEREIMHLGGCFDRRGLEGDPPGIVVQHGIHTVVEDAS